MSRLPFCANSGQCSLEGEAGWCVTHECELARGQTLSVPTQSFSKSLAPIQDLYVAILDGSGSAPPRAKDIEAQLDGVADKVTASPRKDASDGVIVEWNPFPATPKLLTLRFAGKGDGSVQTRIEFQDAFCEVKNPVADCTGQ